MSVVDAGNSRIWTNYNELLGIPLVFSKRWPNLGSTGDLMLVDLSYYLIKDGSGPLVSVSKDVPALFNTNKCAVRIVWNTDGASWLKEPVELEGAAGQTVSPFVILK